MDRALAQGAAYVATGHYARVVVRHGEPYLARPHDKRKDQTYFLSTLTPDRLQHVLFPLADLTKEEVRAKARDLGLPNADKPDSQGICFVGEINLFDFLRSRLPEKPGPIMTVEGELVGEHRGVWFYTIGQRHGLGTVHQSPSAGRVGGAAVSRSVSSGGIPYYVVGKDVTRNTLIVAAGPDHPALYAQAMVVDADVLRVAKTDLLTGLPVEVRIRHGMEPVPATVTFADQSTDRLLVVFDEEQRAVTPGQAAVFYRDGLVVGGGTIAEGTAVRPVPHPAAASVKAR
jgi:tRNA-specific 2-thiouridylase